MFLGYRNNILLIQTLLLHAVSLGETPDFYGPKPVRHQPDAQTGTASKIASDLPAGQHFWDGKPALKQQQMQQ